MASRSFDYMCTMDQNKVGLPLQNTKPDQLICKLRGFVWIASSVFH
ncbi:hypothetical protein RchiOBHm_Chr5g0061341 [Rosa chinensis]|uniref:Uncharacterized protein n=1 Tax=Rosa chinensis TaxID=74649 RepID=A0A2P6QHW4_ROSCH|nr:hypothetical protein RchiOBHm_Chr5g0061341 [Rosa chinensis]